MVKQGWRRSLRSISIVGELDKFFCRSSTDLSNLWPNKPSLCICYAFSLTTSVIPADLDLFYVAYSDGKAVCREPHSIPSASLAHGARVRSLSKWSEKISDHCVCADSWHSSVCRSNELLESISISGGWEMWWGWEWPV